MYSFIVVSISIFIALAFQLTGQSDWFIQASIISGLIYYLLVGIVNIVEDQSPLDILASVFSIITVVACEGLLLTSLIIKVL